MSGPGSIVYRCARRGTVQSLEELSKFPAIRCKSFGYMVLKKTRPPSARKLQSSA